MKLDFAPFAYFAVKSFFNRKIRKEHARDARKKRPICPRVGITWISLL